MSLPFFKGTTHQSAGVHMLCVETGMVKRLFRPVLESGRGAGLRTPPTGCFASEAGVLVVNRDSTTGLGWACQWMRFVVGGYRRNGPMNFVKTFA